MAGASIVVEGLREALAAVQRAQAAKGLPLVVGQAVVAGVKKNFVKGQDPDTGERWKRIRNRAGQPLRDTGRLMRSIHDEYSGAGFRAKIFVGTNVVYAATHQFGDPHRVPKTKKVLAFMIFGVQVFAHKVAIPARPFLPFTDAGLTRTTEGRLPKLVHSYLTSEWESRPS